MHRAAGLAEGGHRADSVAETCPNRFGEYLRIRARLLLTPPRPASKPNIRYVTSPHAADQVFRFWAPRRSFARRRQRKGNDNRGLTIRVIHGFGAQRCLTRWLGAEPDGSLCEATSTGYSPGGEAAQRLGVQTEPPPRSPCGIHITQPQHGFVLRSQH